ncbi:uncharacterized protein EAE97_001641 [Botrytis byssoidea]|uniref:Uncharacterized protein n=1 Tax=Botrytis byssoidea TaxID=139641 RepID=A0A9P5M7V3_9HELO|nr:uncharacterized protein EAE97_001641 [Botrytis byssoidea]KAF7952144.1 hypothetical protein EAE97_001641 [Botrytis byssoidea]
MEPKENKLPCGSQTSTPTNTTSPNSPKDDSVGRLTRQSSIRTQTDKTIPLRKMSQEFDAFSQKVGITSLEEAKHHLQNLGPVPKLPNPAEIEIRKLVEQEEIKIIQEEHKSIRRDSVSFLKRRTSERKTNLATPTLTITTECFRNSPVLSPAVSPARSPTPPDSAVTRIELAAPILGSSSTANLVASSDTLQLDKEQTVPARDTPIIAYTGPFGISNLVLTPIEQENTTSQGHADEHATKNVTSSSSRLATPVFPPRVSSMAPPPPTVVAGWVSDGYTSNYGTPPTSAAQTMGAHPWQDKTASFTVTPIVSSSGQSDTQMELEHKKTNPDALNADGVESSDGTSGVSPQQ